MWGVRITVACAALALAGVIEAGSEAGHPAALLFDGASLAGWRAQGDTGWRAENGELVAGPGAGDGMLVSGETFGNYLLTLPHGSGAFAWKLAEPWARIQCVNRLAALREGNGNGCC